jgi:glycosyltransferase involved in cell wall biosynthesis
MSNEPFQPRHVFHLLPRLNEDGTTHMVATVLTGMDRSRYRVTLCGLSAGNADLAMFHGLADEIHVLGMEQFFDPRAVGRLYALLRRSRVDVLHTHRVRPDIVGRIAGTLARVPINISTQHYVEEWSERGALMQNVVRMLYERTMGLCGTVACNSAAERETLLREIGERYRDQTCVVHNGLDTARYQRPADRDLAKLREALALPGHARVITVVAYLTERKGHRYLLKAIARLRPVFPDIMLLVVGDGPLHAELAALAASLGISECTRFLGVRRDVPTLFALSEVAVLPSLWEPFGLAALEAMAVETPVVVTTSGGLPEFVTQGESGYLVPPADAQALTESISLLLADPPMARRMGQVARNAVLQRFSARHVALAYEDLYERFLDRTDSPSPAAS